MRTIILVIAIVLALAVGRASATNFWLSPSNTSSAPPANASEIPVLPNSGTVYVWGRPDSEKTLVNWALNIHTSDPGVISFVAVDVLNPPLGMFGVPPKPVQRYQFVNESPGLMLPAGEQAINNFQGFTVDDVLVLGVGIGAFTDGVGSDQFIDPFYNAATDSWLMAEITYAAAGGGSTDLFLQIGVSGLNNAFESSAQINVVFGAVTDPALNGGPSGRARDSATPEAHIVGEVVCEPPRFLNEQDMCVPEPSCFVLAALGLFGLAWFGRNRFPPRPTSPSTLSEIRARGAKTLRNAESMRGKAVIHRR